MNRAWLAGVVLLLGACSLLAPLPAEPQRELLQQLPSPMPTAPPGSAVLLVDLPRSPPLLDTTRMPYSRRQFEVSYFNESEWAEKPATMIQALLARTLQATGHFARVTTPPDFSAADLTLSSELLQLMQDYTVSPPVLHAAMRFQLADRRSGAVIASRDLTADEPIHGQGAHAGVIAANGAIARILGDASRFVVAEGAP